MAVRHLSKYWYTEVIVNHRLHRTKEELQTAVEFIVGTDLAVHSILYKHKKKKTIV